MTKGLRLTSLQYTCYPGDFLCPVLDGQKTLRCGQDCYLPNMYSCGDDHLVYPPYSSLDTSTTISSPSSTISASLACAETPSTLHLPDPPYEDFFYSDCHSSTQVVVTSPLPDSDLTLIGPRLLVCLRS